MVYFVHINYKTYMLTNSDYFLQSRIPKKFKLNYLTPTIFINKNYIKNLYISQLETDNIVSEVDLAFDFFFYRNKILAQLEQKSAFILICSWSAQLGPIYFFLLDCLATVIFSLYMNKVYLKIYLIQVVHNKK